MIEGQRPGVDVLPPHSMEAEMALLGAMLYDPAVYAGTREIVGADDWYDTRHRTVYEALATLEGWDLVIVKDALATSGKLDGIGGAAYLMDLVEKFPSSSNAAEYARIVATKARERKALEAVRLVTVSLRDGQPTNGLAEHAIEALSSLGDAFGPRERPIIASELAAESLPPIEYLLNPLWARSTLSQIQGEPKGGKSCFALLAAISVAAGRWAASRWSVHKAQSVLYISWEDGKRRLQERIKLYCAGMGIEPPLNLLLYPKEIAPRMRLDKGGGSTLRKIIEDTGVSGVIIDTLSHLSAGDENSKEAMQPVLDALHDTINATGAAIMTIHHTGKPGQGQERSVAYKGRGSSAIAAAYDTILDWGSRVADNTTLCKLIGKDIGSDEFHVVYDDAAQDGAVLWKLADAAPIERTGETRRKILERVLDYLKTSESIDRSTLAQIANVDAETARYHLSALVTSGLLSSTRGQRNKISYSLPVKL